MLSNFNSISGYYKSRPLPTIHKTAKVYAWCYLKAKKYDSNRIQSLIKRDLSKYGFNLEAKLDAIDIFKKHDCEVRVEFHNEFIVVIAIDYTNSYRLSQLASKGLLQDAITHHLLGELLSHCELIFVKPNSKKVNLEQLNSHFDNDQYIASNVYENAARVWTSFTSGQTAKSIKIIIEDFSLGVRRRGRLLQDLVELIFYKNLAELASPIAEKLSQQLANLEVKLLRLNNQIYSASDTDVQKKLLTKLLDISIKTEWWQNSTGHRFSASEAYMNIFKDRLSAIEESKVEGYQTITSFYTKITAPTFRTYQSTNTKLLALIKRIDRAIMLLNTRVRATVEAQNHELLRSSNIQTKQQVALQETIEAFALVAICFNGNALIQLLLESLVAQGIEIPIALITTITIPVICISSYLLMRLLRKRNKEKLT